MDLTDLIFTHNHPSGGCFSSQDISEMMKANLYELRASTPQGTYHSLIRTPAAKLDSDFAEQFAKQSSIMKAMKQVEEDMKSGIVSKQTIKDRGFDIYVDYMSRNSEKFLEENASKYGFKYTKGAI